MIKHAAAMGLDVDIGAVEKAKALLGQSKQQKQNIPAMLWADAPSFYQSLDEATQAGLALKLLMLAGTILSGSYAEADEFEEDIWQFLG